MALRRFIFKNTETEEVLVLPVTPGGYQIGHGRNIVQVDMYGTGEVNLPGEHTLLNETITAMFPAHAYAFNQPEAGTNPFVPLEKLERWSDAGVPVRFIISDTPVNALVLLGQIRYGEQDGTNDLYVSIPIRGYRILGVTAMETGETGNAARPVETKPARGTSYIVRAGDTLSSIARWAYGDASLYGRIAAANNIANPHLIYVGQVLTLPDVEALPAALPATGISARVKEATTTTWDSSAARWKVQLSKEEAMGF